MKEYVLKNYVSDTRVQTVSMKLLLLHIEYAKGMAELMKRLCIGKKEGLDEIAENFYNSLGKYETEYERYYDHFLCVYSLRQRIAEGELHNVGGI